MLAINNFYTSNIFYFHSCFWTFVKTQSLCMSSNYNETGQHVRIWLWYKSLSMETFVDWWLEGSHCSYQAYLLLVKKFYMLCEWYQNYMTGVVLDNTCLKQLYLIESKSLAHWSKIAKYFLQILPDSLVINHQICTSIPLLTNSLSKYSHYNDLTCSDASLYVQWSLHSWICYIISTTKTIHHNNTVLPCASSYWHNRNCSINYVHSIYTNYAC